MGEFGAREMPPPFILNRLCLARSQLLVGMGENLPSCLWREQEGLSELGMTLLNEAWPSSIGSSLMSD